jgi:hypothetical protein
MIAVVIDNVPMELNRITTLENLDVLLNSCRKLLRTRVSLSFISHCGFRIQRKYSKKTVFDNFLAQIFSDQNFAQNLDN